MTAGTSAARAGQAVNELLRELDQVENRIERSVQRGIISQREAISLRREANQIRGQLQLRQPQRPHGREFADAAGPGQPARAARCASSAATATAAAAKR